MAKLAASCCWKSAALLAAFITALLLLLTPPAGGNCGLYGCTLSLSYTCMMDFYEGSFFPELAQSFEDDKLVPTGAGCAANHQMIMCPFTGGSKNVMIAWRMMAQFDSWNVSASHTLMLPAVDVSGNIYFSDGYDLYGYDDTGDPLGRKEHMFPENGSLYDMTIVSDQFLYLLYKSGFMVAFFTDATAYASVWLNTTLDGKNGTFVPLSNPAVSGQRVYFLAEFRPFEPYPPGHMTTTIRLYAIDVRIIMAGRIKVIWYYEYELTGTPIPLENTRGFKYDTARVIVQKDVVVGMLNYAVIPGHDNTTCKNGKCDDNQQHCSNGFFGAKSLMISLTDQGETFKLNILVNPRLPFQAVSFVDPTITSRQPQGLQNEAPPTDLWVSWCNNDSYSVISAVNPLTGKSVPAMTKISALTNVTLTSKITIFYNDNQNKGAANNTAEAVLMPLVFGYVTSSGDAYVAAVDVSGSEPELRWTQKMPGNNPALGQVTTTGLGRDTMMFVTTSKGAYFFELFSDKNH